MKSCSDKTCKQVNPQPLSCFSKNSARPDGLQYYCKTCSKEKIKTDQKNNPDKWAGYARKYRVNNYDKHRENAKKYKSLHPERVKNTVLKRNFGITIDQFNKMFSAQGGCCLICGRHASEFKKSLAVDHCHKTGKIRGLLCHHCNTAIGLLQDEPVLAVKLAEYLKGHQC